MVSPDTGPPGLRRSTPPNNAATEAILREYEITKQAGIRRHQFLDNLMDHIASISAERDDALRKLGQTERINNAYQDDLNLANQKIDALQKAQDCDRFVLAVVDGDNALFNDDLVKMALLVVNELHRSFIRTSLITSKTSPISD
jgi:hypothetical protein